eukprot:GFUD01049205.1.p1 GENE.GFUD01049205.1~~GFUD01049205.1.p1  ORF type:complete len:101 (-),score=31.50 GFUD01049205.1:14-316(-)
MASLSAHTQNIPLTQQARFWSNYVSALKGNQDLRVSDPTIIETVPYEYPDLMQQFDRPKRAAQEPLTPVMADGNDRIHSLGYSYYPVHTEIYGTYRPGGR